MLAADLLAVLPADLLSVPQAALAAVALLAGLAQLHLFPPEPHAGFQLGAHYLRLCSSGPAALCLLAAVVFAVGFAGLVAAVLAANQISHPR